MSDVITCEACKEEFEPDWSDEEASLEFHQKFPGHDIKNAAVVCDDCWIKMGFGDDAPGPASEHPASQ